MLKKVFSNASMKFCLTDEELSRIQDGSLASAIEKTFQDLYVKWVEAVDEVLRSSGMSVEEIKANCKEIEYQEAIFNDSMEEEVKMREVLYGNVVIARMTRTGYRYKIDTGWDI